MSSDWFRERLNGIVDTIIGTAVLALIGAASVMFSVEGIWFQRAVGAVVTAFVVAVAAGIAHFALRTPGNNRHRALNAGWRIVIGGAACAAIAVVGYQCGRLIHPQTRGIAGSIDRVAFLSVDCAAEAMKPGAKIWMAVSITNSGPPSAIHDYVLTIVSADGRQRMPMRLLAIPDNFRVEISDNQEHVYMARDALYNVTGTPVPRGGRVSGILVYATDRVTPLELRQAGTRYILAFQNVKDEETLAEYVWPPFATGCTPQPRLEWPK